MTISGSLLCPCNSEFQNHTYRVHIYWDKTNSSWLRLIYHFTIQLKYFIFMERFVFNLEVKPKCVIVSTGDFWGKGWVQTAALYLLMMKSTRDRITSEYIRPVFSLSSPVYTCFGDFYHISGDNQKYQRHSSLLLTKAQFRYAWD